MRFRDDAEGEDFSEMLRRSWMTLAIAGLAATSLADDGSPGVQPPLHPVEIRNPPSLGTVDTGLRDAEGASVGIACVTCHAPGDEGALARKNEVPDDFHAGIEIEHGKLRCESCHDPEDLTRLRLAHGESVAMGDVLELCGQCHGPKLRDFNKGSHGGGRGYWDRSKGPWIRNSCVACHRAHAPAYPLVMPAPPPNDRFMPLPSKQTTEEGPNHE